MTSVNAASPLSPSSSSPSAKDESAFRTISEVAASLGVQQHVLRFWETKFSQVKPLKRRGGRRYYRPEDVALLHRIHTLLYTEGYTIKGVQKLLKETARARVLAGRAGGQEEKTPFPSSSSPLSPAVQVYGEGLPEIGVPASPSSSPSSPSPACLLREVLAELESMREQVRQMTGEDSAQLA